MKPTDQKPVRCLPLAKSILRLRAFVVAVAILIALTPPLVQQAGSATQTKANNTNNLNLTSSWVGGVVPTSSDIALWDSTVTSNNTVSLGGNLNFGQIKITNPGGNVFINTGNTLTLSGISGVGIDMSSTALLVISCNVTLGAAQTWQNGNGSGNTLTLNAVDNAGNLLTISGIGSTNLQGVI